MVLGILKVLNKDELKRTLIKDVLKKLWRSVHSCSFFSKFILDLTVTTKHTISYKFIIIHSN